jgi:hypothetical protein
MPIFLVWAFVGASPESARTHDSSGRGLAGFEFARVKGEWVSEGGVQVYEAREVKLKN